jgi:Acetyltransferase (GNAT) domain
VGLCSHGKLEAFCSLFPSSWLHKKHGLVRAVCVGSVCAHPRARGQGLATCVLQQAFALASVAEYDFIFLFSDMLEFYGRLGYQPAGQEPFYHFDPRQLKVSASNEQKLDVHAKRLNQIGFAKHRSFSVVANLANLSYENLAELWQHVCLCGARSESVLGFTEFQKMMLIPQMQLVQSRNQGKLVGSFFVGKGHDFQDVAHGVAVRDSAEFLWLLAKWREHFPQLAFTLSAGPWAKILEKEFTSTQTPSVLLQGLDDTWLSISEIKNMFQRGEIYVRSLHSS